MPRKNEMSDEENLRRGQEVYDRLPIGGPPGTVAKELEKAYRRDNDER